MSDNDILHTVCYGNSLFVTGGDVELQTSSNGITWTKRTINTSENNYWIYGSCYSNGLYIVVGYSIDDGYSVHDSEIHTSADGITWTKRTAGNSFNKRFFSISYGNGTFVVVGEDGEIQTSTDGITWTHRTAAASFSDDITRVRYINDRFIILGGYYSDCEIQSSIDGITWTHIANNEDNEDLSSVWVFNDVIYDDTYNEYIFVGGDNGDPANGVVYSSTDLSSFNKQNEFADFDKNQLYSIAYGNGVYKIASQNAYIYTSPNVKIDCDRSGWLWHFTEEHVNTVDTNNDYFDVAYGNYRFIAVGGRESGNASIQLNYFKSTGYNTGTGNNWTSNNSTPIEVEM